MCAAMRVCVCVSVWIEAFVAERARINYIFIIIVIIYYWNLFADK